jgi:hypothetical protein
LVFVDKTNLTVGPTSEVLLDKFVYDPTGSKGNVVFQATRGTFLFVTGTQDHRAYAVNTPYGSLGDAPADSALGLRGPDNFNREFQAMDREARTIFQSPLHEHDVPNERDVMAYGPGQNENESRDGKLEKELEHRGQGFRRGEPWLGSTDGLRDS